LPTSNICSISIASVYGTLSGRFGAVVVHCPLAYLLMGGFSYSGAEVWGIWSFEILLGVTDLLSEFSSFFGVGT